jgi:hypothetical protein
MSKYKNRAINIYKNKICIREKDGTYNFLDDENISILFNEIDKNISSNPIPMRPKEIIFKCLNDLFNVDHSFNIPGTLSSTPDKDNLYTNLVQHIMKNELFKNKYIKSDEAMKNMRDAIRKEQLKYPIC